MTRWLMFFCAGAVLAAVPVYAQDSDIRALLTNSAAAWNRGDLAAFASDYEDSPDTTFIGKEVTKGNNAAILARYRRGYPTRDAMGTLTFSEIEVRPLAPGVALASGKFSLQRTAAGGGDTSGHFTLVLRQTKAGWKIIHDHSS